MPKLIFTLIEILILFFQVWIASLVGYLLLLTVTSFRAERHTKLQPGDQNKRFTILIPAHNEERLLPELLRCLKHLDYPKNNFEVHVVADNCTDQTALVAQNEGVDVHVRTDKNNPGKGPALQWFLDQMWPSEMDPDAIVIVDADTLLSANFLSVIAGHLERGEKVIQAYYSVRDPSQSWSSGLRYAALAVLHFLRPQGRMVLGGSVGLKGNGMIFSSEVLRRYRWSASVTEDIELHMSIILGGGRVTFAPDAIALGEMPNLLANSKSQHKRWEAGRLEMARRYIPKLFHTAWTEAKAHHLEKAYLFFDAIMEHLVPPFSILFGVNILLLIFNLGVVTLLSFYQSNLVSSGSFGLAKFNILFSTILLVGQVIYLISGLRLVKAPRRAYLNLIYTPIYMVWKFIQYFQVITRRGQLEWIRTRRNEG